MSDKFTKETIMAADVGVLAMATKPRRSLEWLVARQERLIYRGDRIVERMTDLNRQLDEIHSEILEVQAAAAAMEPPPDEAPPAPPPGGSVKIAVPTARLGAKSEG